MFSSKVIVVDTTKYTPNGLLENYLKDLHGDDIIILTEEQSRSLNISSNSLKVKYIAPQSDLVPFPNYVTGQEKRRIRRDALRKRD